MARKTEIPSPPKLADVWKFIWWLENTWFSQADVPAHESARGRWPVFSGLKPAQKLLTHWLCYIFDRVQPTTRLWANLPIFAELCREYVSAKDQIELVESFTRTLDNRKAAVYVAKSTRDDGELLEFRPRFDELPAVISTLLILERYDRNIPSLLARHWQFICDDKEPVEATRRIAFLLHVLTYRDVGIDKTGPWDEAVKKATERANDTLKLLTNFQAGEESAYEKWKGDRFSGKKRLWAALRDWLRSDGRSLDVITSFSDVEASFKDIGRADIADYVSAHRQELLSGLELPGDVWNTRFFKWMFKLGREQWHPGILRTWYDKLERSGELRPEYKVSQFDVTFFYSARMCERHAFGSCIFRRDSRIWEQCPPRSNIEWRGRLCPVTDHLCGFEYRCNPDGCPVRVAEPKDLCPGCQWNQLPQIGVGP